jgi:hypothetical protein
MRLHILRPRRLSVLLLGLALSLSACNKEHDACFSIEDPSFVCPGVEVQFTNCGDPDDSYSWAFGDGEGIKTISPTHTYLTLDTMWVYCDAGSGKKKDRDSLSFIVALPTANVLRLTSFPELAPDGGTWDPNGSGPDARLWIFDEGGATIYNSPAYSNIAAGHAFDMGGLEMCRSCVWNVLVLDSQAGGSDPDTLFYATFTYADLAAKRISDHSVGTTTAQFEFFAH